MEQITSQLAPPRAAQAGKNGNAEGSSTGGSVTRRLSSELMTLMMSASPGISAFPRSDSNLFDWVATIEGPSETVYAGLTFRVGIVFPSNYPYVPPALRFETPCWHPNVDIERGAICLDILQDKWSAVYSVQTILLSLQSLLGEPNNASPLNPDAADIWDKPEEFKSYVMKHYRPLASA